MNEHEDTEPHGWGMDDTPEDLWSRPAENENAGYDYNTVPFIPETPVRRTRRMPTALLIALESAAALVVLAALTLTLQMCGVISLGGHAETKQPAVIEAVITPTAEPAAAAAAPTTKAQSADTLGDPLPFIEQDDGTMTPPEADVWITAVSASTTTELNLRRGPGTDYEVIEVLPESRSLNLWGEQDGWYWVECGGVYGWVSEQYVTQAAEA